MIRKLVQKYLDRNKRSLDSENILYEMDAIVLTETNDAGFKIRGIMTAEVEQYCWDLGYQIDKIVFLTAFDTDTKRDRKGSKMDSDAKIIIVEEEGKIIAQVFLGSWIEIK